MENSRNDNNSATLGQEVKVNFWKLMGSVKAFLKEKEIEQRVHIPDSVEKCKLDPNLFKVGMVGYIVGVMGTRSVFAKPLICAGFFSLFWKLSKIKI